MFPSTVLTAMSPLLFAVPWNKHLEDTCKEISKQLQKKAKSTLGEKLTETVVEKIVCKEVGKLDKTLTKAATSALKKQLDKAKKDVEKDMAKKDPGSAQVVALTGLRDDMIKARKERDAMEAGKPIKLPKPMGGGLHVPFKVKVLSKDKIELEVNGFVGVGFKELLNGKVPLTYGGLGVGGRF